VLQWPKLNNSDATPAIVVITYGLADTKEKVRVYAGEEEIFCIVILCK